MVSAADIRDEASLRTWLEGRPREDAVVIAARAALRVVPFYWDFVAAKPDRSQSELAISKGCLLIAYMATVKADGKQLSDLQIRAVAACLDYASDATNWARLPAAAARPRGHEAGAISADIVRAAAFTCDPAVSSVRIVNAAKSTVSWTLTVLSEAGVSEQAVIWACARLDAQRIEEKLAPFLSPLWFQGIANWFPIVHRDWRVRGGGWVFWADWYEGYLTGQPLDIDLLEKVALIPPEDWDKGDDHVNGIIAAIYDAYRRKAPDRIDPLFAALFDFTFDKFAGVMRAIPMPDDWQTLTDPARLASFLADATDLRDDLELLASALAAEGQAMQGAGAVRAYLNAVERELARAEEFRTLRVGKLLEYGRILEAASLNEETLREFGATGEALKICVAKLRDLVRAHFAHTLSRLGILRDMRMEEGVSPWEVLREFRFLVEDVKTGAQGRLPKLAGEDAAVLTDILDSVDGMIRSLENNSPSANARDGLKREIDFQLAKVVATGRVYGDRAARAVGKSNDAANAAIKAHKKWEGLQAIGRAVREFLEGGGGT